MHPESTKDLESVFSSLLIQYPLYQFRKKQGDTYRLRVFLNVGGAHLAAALGEILPNGQLLDTQLEVTVCSPSALADGAALLENAPDLHRFVKVHGLTEPSAPECQLAVLTFRQMPTEEEIAAQRSEWDYILLCGDNSRAYAHAFGCDADRLVAYLHDGRTDITSPHVQKLDLREDTTKDAQLEQIAYNLHYAYAKYNDSRASREDIRDGFSKDYNKDATLKNVLHIRSKLACCGITDDNFAVAARKFATQMKAEPAIVGRLAVLEHNRWLFTKLLKGFRLPEDVRQIYQCSADNTHSEKSKWHVCMLPCDYTHRLTQADWNADKTNWRPELDRLDRMSLEVHHVCREIAEDYRSDIENAMNSIGTTLGKWLQGQDQQDAQHYLKRMQIAISQMYQKKRIATHRYDKSSQMLKNLLSRYTQKWAEQVKNALNEVNTNLKPLREYIIDKDYKEQNYLLVEQIPFALTHKSDPVLVKFFDASGDDCQFSPWQMEPTDVIYIAFADTVEHLSKLQAKAEHIHNFLAYSCSAVADQFHVLVTEDIQAVSSDQAVIHRIPSRKSADILPVLAKILQDQNPDYMDMTGVNPALSTAAGLYAEQMDIGTFYVSNSRMFNISSAEELEYPAPIKGITVREMFDQAGAVLVGSEGSHISDLSNVYQAYWNVSRSTDQWDAFCKFISNAYKKQETEKTYALPNLKQNASFEKYTLQLKSGVLADLRPVIRDLEAQGYIEDAKAHWIVGDSLELEFRAAGQNTVDALSALFQEHDHNHIYDVKWKKCRPTVEVRQLSIKDAELPAHCEEEYARLLTELNDAHVIRNLQRKGNTVSFEFSAVEFLSSLRNSGKVLEYYLYNTALQTCQFDDVDMSWMFFHSAESGSAENEVDVICTKGITSLFISAKNVTLNTVKTHNFLNYVCYEVSLLADRFGINTKTILAAPNVPQFEKGKRSQQVEKAMSRGVYLLGDKCFEGNNLGRILDNISRGEENWCEFLKDQ